MDAPPALEGMIGDKGFDPLGFSNFIPVKFLREAGEKSCYRILHLVILIVTELKHGRIAMLATLGYIVTEFVKLPGDVHSVSPLEAHNAAVASGAMFQIAILVSALEFVSVVAVKEMFDGDRQPGDYAFDPLNLLKGTQFYEN
jgi:hypothetical protein